MPIFESYQLLSLEDDRISTAASTPVKLSNNNLNQCNYTEESEIDFLSPFKNDVPLMFY